MTDIGTGAPYTIQNTIPSYLYRQYADDEALQAFANAENDATQAYIDWFNQINLPVYTSGTIVGELLDWVGTGLYGVPRPVFPVARLASKGAFNTLVFNSAPFNSQQSNAQAYYTADDDIYKRTITWIFYKGDGFQFTINWLKRRIIRFLNGTNGVSPTIDNTYPVSVTFGPGTPAGTISSIVGGSMLNLGTLNTWSPNQTNITWKDVPANPGSTVNIGILPGASMIVGGSIPNGGALNTFTPNQTNIDYSAYPVSPALQSLIAGIQSGVLPLPFQFQFVVST